METNGENNQRHQTNGVHKALPLETSAGFYALNAEAEARRAIVDEETSVETSVSLVDLLAQAVLDKLAEEQQMDQLLDLVVKRVLELQQEEALYLQQKALSEQEASNKQEVLREKGSGQEAPGPAPALVPAIVNGSSRSRPRLGAKRLYKRRVPG